MLLAIVASLYTPSSSRIPSRSIQAHKRPIVASTLPFRTRSHVQSERTIPVKASLDDLDDVQRMRDRKNKKDMKDMKDTISFIDALIPQEQEEEAKEGPVTTRQPHLAQYSTSIQDKLSHFQRSVDGMITYPRHSEVKRLTPVVTADSMHITFLRAAIIAKALKSTDQTDKSNDFLALIYGYLFVPMRLAVEHDATDIPTFTGAITIEEFLFLYAPKASGFTLRSIAIDSIVPLGKQDIDVLLHQYRMKLLEIKRAQRWNPFLITQRMLIQNQLDGQADDSKVIVKLYRMCEFVQGTTMPEMDEFRKRLNAVVGKHGLYEHFVIENLESAVDFYNVAGLNITLKKE